MFPTSGAGDIVERVGTVVLRKHGTMASEKFEKILSEKLIDLCLKLCSLETSEPRHSKFRLEMRANAQRDGRPAEYRWHPLFNAAKFG